MVVTLVNETNVKPEYDKEIISDAITNLTGKIDLAVPVIDIEVYDYCKNESSFKMIVTLSLNGTYQNVLFFYNVFLN